MTFCLTSPGDRAFHVGPALGREHLHVFFVGN